MKKRTIDLSDIKESELEKTASFTDLMNKTERKKYLEEKYNFEDIERIKKKNKKSKENVKDDILSKTQALDFTRTMKFNFEEVKEENNKSKKKGISKLNVIGEVNLLCIGYYIYLLAFTSFQDKQDNYVLNGGIIISLVLFFGMSVITNKKSRKFFMLINVLTILVFIIFNVYTLLY